MARALGSESTIALYSGCSFWFAGSVSQDLRACGSPQAACAGGGPLAALLLRPFAPINITSPAAPFFIFESDFTPIVQPAMWITGGAPFGPLGDTARPTL